MSSVALVVGVSRYLGSRVAAHLAADPAVDRVVGIDTAPPRAQDLPLLGRVEFVRADIRNPLAAKVVTQARVTTVVHTALAASSRQAGGRAAMQEMNRVGTMQLLAACQKSETVARVVLASSGAVYGAGPRQPAVLTEATPPAPGRSGYARDVLEVERLLRGFARRCPEVETTVLRLAELFGADVDSALSRYLATPVVPTPLGHDPRLQVLHPRDAVEVLRQAATSSRPGTFNVAADGVLTLSQLIRRTARAELPVLRSALNFAGAVLRNSGVAEFGDAATDLVPHGRILDTAALREGFGYAPTVSIADAAAEFRAAHPLRPHLPPAIGSLGPAGRLVRTALNAVAPRGGNASLAGAGS